MWENCLYRVSAKAIIYNNKWEFLLVRNEYWNWWFPWWWIEYWEAIEEWLRREIKEELGVEVVSFYNHAKVLSLFSPFGDMTFWKFNICYEVTVGSFNFIPNEECLEFWFFNKVDAYNLPLVRWATDIFDKL